MFGIGICKGFDPSDGHWYGSRKASGGFCIENEHVEYSQAYGSYVTKTMILNFNHIDHITETMILDFDQCTKVF